jgi:hypothetical protein
VGERTRVEWGHAWADPERQRQFEAETGPGAVLRLCRTRVHDVDEPCLVEVTNGYPIRHVWRRVTTTAWQDGAPPVASNSPVRLDPAAEVASGPVMVTCEVCGHIVQDVNATTRPDGTLICRLCRWEDEPC